MIPSMSNFDKGGQPSGSVPDFRKTCEVLKTSQVSHCLKFGTDPSQARMFAQGDHIYVKALAEKLKPVALAKLGRAGQMNGEGKKERAAANGLEGFGLSAIGGQRSFDKPGDQGWLFDWFERHSLVEASLTCLLKDAPINEAA